MSARNLRRVTDTVAQLRQLAAKGFTYKDAAKALGLKYHTVSRHCTDYSIPLLRGKQGIRKPTKVNERTLQMAALYKSGKTLQEIGDQFGITRERVRQLITVLHGLTRNSGGEHKRSLEKRAKFEARRNARSLKRWGCNWDQYVAIRDLKKPTRAYATQRRNAMWRGIDWELNLWQWWSIWQQSGKWSERGRGQGYVMCRNGDVGPYAIDNVFISTARENCSLRPQKKSGLPMGVSKNGAAYKAARCLGGKRFDLGSHSTPELAHAAYLAAGERKAA